MPGSSSPPYLASARLLALLTLASRVLGLVRDMLMASLFGASLVLDAWILAFTIPNLFRRLFGEGALQAAFIPTFAQALEQEGPERARRVLSLVATRLVLWLVLIAAAGTAGCLVWRALAAPDPRTSLFCLLLALLLPYIVLICLVALLSGALNTLDHFLLPAMAPILFNVCWIAALGGLVWRGGAPERQVLLLAGAVVAAGLAQVLLLLPALARRGCLPRPAFDRGDQALKKIAGAMAPVVFGVAVFQLNVLADRGIAWWLVEREGALSVLYLGNRLMQFPLGVIGVALATAVFPLLSRLAAAGQAQRFRDVLADSLEVALFLALPATVGLILVREPLIRLFFEHRAFTAEAAARTATVLSCYSIGIWAACLTSIATRGFYSIDEVRLPVRVGLATVGLNLALDLALVFPLGEAGLALATALAQVAQAVLLVALLDRRLRRTTGAGLQARRLALGALRVCALCAVMGVVVQGAAWLASDCGRTVRLLAEVGAGVVTYLALARVFAPELLQRLLHARD